MRKLIFSAAAAVFATISAWATTEYENAFRQVITGSYRNTDKDADGFFVIRGNSYVVVSNLEVVVDGDIVRGGMIEIRDKARVTMYLAGTNRLVSAQFKRYCGAGIFVEKGSSLTICDLVNDNPGSLTVEGGRWGAAIGGYCGSCGAITIKGGNIVATAIEQAAAIGAGDGRTSSATYDRITISGGTVVANAGSLSAAIGGGYECRGGVVEITGGKVTANGAFGIGSGSGAVGSYTNIVTGGEVKCSNGGIYPAPVNAQGEPYSFGVRIDGTDVGSLAGRGWSYSPSSCYVTLDDPSRTYLITGTNTTGKLMIGLRGDVRATIKNLCLTSTKADECCVWVEGTRNGATLCLEGTNTLTSTGGEGVAIEDKSILTITRAAKVTDDENAVLRATGAEGYAAISVGYRNRYYSTGFGSVLLRGGHIIARGGRHAAGIGNGDKLFYGGGLEVFIDGGFVEAYGGTDSAGIGGGYDSLVGVVHIAGGTVLASRGSRERTLYPDLLAVDLSCGYHRTADWCSGNYFTGGSIVCAHLDADREVRPEPLNASSNRVWQVTVAGLPDGAAEVAGLKDYGVRDLRTIDGKLRLWLPNGVHAFTVNGEDYRATVNGANTEAERWTPPPPVPTYRVAFPSMPHIQSVTATTNGVPVEQVSPNVYLVEWGSYIEITFTAEDGYSFTRHGNAVWTCAFYGDYRETQYIDAVELETVRLPVTRGITVNGENIGRWTSEYGDWTYIEEDLSQLHLKTPIPMWIEFSGTNTLFGIYSHAGGGSITLRPAKGWADRATILSLRVLDCPDTEVTVAGGTITNLVYGRMSSLTVKGGSFARPQDLAVVPSNGVAAVWCVTVPCTNGVPVVTGLSSYGLDGVVAVDGALHLWLPDGRYGFSVNGRRMRAVVSGADTTAVEVIDPEPKAVYTVADRTLTFHYDIQDYETVEGERYVWTDLAAAGWSADDPAPNARAATNVVLDAAFAAYQPGSTRSWFSHLRNITELDLTLLNLSATTNALDMFSFADSLRTIYVSDMIMLTNCPSRMAAGMFDACVDLIGEQGTKFDWETHGDPSQHWRYAHVDGENSWGDGFLPGFYSRKRVPVTLTVPDPLPTNCAAVAVYERGVLVGETNGVYTTKAGYSMRVVYKVAEGFELPDGSSEYAFTYPALDADTVVDLDEMPPRLVKQPRPIGVLSGSTLTLYFDNLDHADGDSVYVGSTWAKWVPEAGRKEDSPIQAVVIDPTFAACRPVSTARWFIGCQNLVSFTGLEYLDTSCVTEMDYMFCGCSGLEQLVVGETFVTNSLQTSAYMFDQCTSLRGQFGTDYGFFSRQGVVDARAACVDFGPDRPGLFTAIVPYEAAVLKSGVQPSFHHTLTGAVSKATVGSTVKMLADRPTPFTLTVGKDFAFDCAGHAIPLAVEIDDAFLTLSNTVNVAAGLKIRLGNEALLAFAGTLPADDILVSVMDPSFAEGSLVITNAWGALPEASKVRICQAGKAAFPAAGGIAVWSAWSRPFVRIDALGSTTNFTPFATFAEAAATSSAVVGVLDYVNDVLPFETNRFDAAVSVSSGKCVTLTSALRYSPDATNTCWSAEAKHPSTLCGPVEVAGTLVLGAVRLEGGLTILPGGQLVIGEGFDLAGAGRLYVTLANPEAQAASTQTVITATGVAPAALKTCCRITNPGWTFWPGEHGLEVRAVGDKVARIGEVYYDSFEDSLSAVTNRGTICLLSYTNETTHTHLDVVSARVREYKIPESLSFTLASARRTTIGSEYSWDDAPKQLTTLDLDGVALQLERGVELCLSNVNVSGTIALSGEGRLDVRHYQGERIRVRLGRAEEMSLNRAIALGAASQFELVDSDGELEDRDGYVFWKVNKFHWSYAQTGNGKGEITVNDGGAVKHIPVESQNGSFSYLYVRDAGAGTELLSGYLLYIDYDHKEGEVYKPLIRLPDVKTEYRNDEDAWRTVRNGEIMPLDWKVDSNGCLTFRFGDDVRTIKGVASKPTTVEEFVKDTAKSCGDDDNETSRVVGAVIGAGAGGAAIGGVLYFISQGGILGGGALGGAIVGGGAFNVVVNGGGGGGGLEPEDPGLPGEDVPQPQPPDPAVVQDWTEKFQTFLKWAEKFMDVYTVAQMLKDIVQMFGCPLEYKGVPYFASRFGHVHELCANDNNAAYGIHWFFTKNIHSIAMPNNGEVDISADRSLADFMLSELAAGSLPAGSPFERFQDSMNWVMRIDGIYNLVKDQKLSPEGVLAIVGEVVSLLKNIVQQAQKRGYFDPPNNMPVLLQTGSRYNVVGMEFGTKSSSPKAPRTAPILRVSSGSRLSISDSSMKGYTYGGGQGLIHVEEGGVLTLEKFEMSGNVSSDGTPPITVEPGGVVYLAGKCSINDLSAAGATVSIGIGPHRNQAAQSANLLDGSAVYISGATRVGGTICANAFTNSTGWSMIHSKRYDRWIEPSAEGTVVKWAWRPGVETLLTPGFDPQDPFSIRLFKDDRGVSKAHFGGTITNAVSGFSYGLLGTTELKGEFLAVPGAVQEAGGDGRMKVDLDAPAETPAGFFKFALEF